MRVITIPENNYSDILALFEQHCARGVSPDDLRRLADAYDILRQAPAIDLNHMGAVNLAEVGPNRLVLQIQPEPAKDAVRE